MSRTEVALLAAACGLEEPDARRWPLPDGWFATRQRERAAWRAEFARDYEAIVLQQEKEKMRKQLTTVKELAVAAENAHKRLMDALRFIPEPSPRPSKRARSDEDRGGASASVCSEIHRTDGSVELRFLSAYDSDEEEVK